jgi:hypothetical protein
VWRGDGIKGRSGFLPQTLIKSFTLTEPYSEKYMFPNTFSLMLKEEGIYVGY